MAMRISRKSGMRSSELPYEPRQRKTSRTNDEAESIRERAAIRICTTPLAIVARQACQSLGNSAIRNIFKASHSFRKTSFSQGKQKTPGALRYPGVISSNPIPFKMRLLRFMANSIACEFVIECIGTFPPQSRSTRVPVRQVKNEAVAHFC